MQKATFTDVDSHMAVDTRRSEKDEIARFQFFERNTVPFHGLGLRRSGQMRIETFIEDSLDQRRAIDTVLALSP